MFVAGISSGSIRNRAIATPSKTSSASGTPTIRRFDVLLNEQVLCHSLCYSILPYLNISTELFGGGGSRARPRVTKSYVFHHDRSVW